MIVICCVRCCEVASWCGVLCVVVVRVVLSCVVLC